MLGRTQPPAVVPWLRRDQWSRFCEVFAGEDRLPATYDEWLELNRGMGASAGVVGGIESRRVEIDVEALVRWCRTHRRVVDPMSMMLFAGAVAYAQDHPGSTVEDAPPPPRMKATTVRLWPGGPKITFHVVQGPSTRH